MRILIIGSGGREHALAWRLSQDEGVDQVFVSPGNPGMKELSRVTLIPGEISLGMAEKIALAHEIDLVVIGPEKYLFEGWVDALAEKGIRAYGPKKAASFLEESKIKSKIFMKEQNIPTAEFEVASHLDEAIAAVNHHPEWAGYVLKLSGPALGKGVIVTHSAEEAKAAAKQFFQYHPPGLEEGMVIENVVSGREVSLFYVCKGTEYRFLASACDHKRLRDQDQGPNTGGMGAYSPCYWIDEKFLSDAESRFVIPTLEGMKKKGTPFSGTLFLGLMVNAHDTSLLEYNVRFGDPETQTFLPLLQGNLAQLLFSACDKESSFSATELKQNGKHSLHVVKAARGYPGLFGEAIESGVAIRKNSNRTEHTPSHHWFFAGVSDQNSGLVTSGGRVCGITAIGNSLGEAKKTAYQQISEVSFAGEHYRMDIGGGTL